MAYPVVWLNQSSKFSLRYMYIYMGKSKFIHKNSLNDNVCAKIPLSP